MSFDDAKRFFEKNTRLINHAENPTLWNLNSGMLSLIEAIEYDLQEVHRTLDKVLRALQQPR